MLTHGVVFGAPIAIGDQSVNVGAANVTKCYHCCMHARILLQGYVPLTKQLAGVPEKK